LRTKLRTTSAMPQHLVDRMLVEVDGEGEAVV